MSERGCKLRYILLNVNSNQNWKQMVRWFSKVAVYGRIAITDSEWYAMVARL